MLKKKKLKIINNQKLTIRLVVSHMYKIKIKKHSEDDFLSMRKAGRLAFETLEYIEPFVKPGISTLEINDLCHKFTVKNNAVPGPLNYKGFPRSVCTSVNDVVCHGVPRGDVILKDGDIIGVDVTPIVDGWYGDTCKTFLVGDSFNEVLNQKSNQIKKFVSVAYEAMMAGISEVKPGKPFRNIGLAIQEIAERSGFSVVRDFCGHGVGRKFHEDPSILHYAPMRDYYGGLTMEEGNIFTIEPMINLGHYDVFITKEDGWTVKTVDGSLSAQFEHSIGVTNKGYIVFTNE